MRGKRIVVSEDLGCKRVGEGLADVRAVLAAQLLVPEDCTVPPQMGHPGWHRSDTGLSLLKLIRVSDFGRRSRTTTGKKDGGLLWLCKMTILVRVVVLTKELKHVGVRSSHSGKDYRLQSHHSELTYNWTRRNSKQPLLQSCEDIGGPIQSCILPCCSTDTRGSRSGERFGWSSSHTEIAFRTCI